MTSDQAASLVSLALDYTTHRTKLLRSQQRDEDADAISPEFQEWQLAQRHNLNVQICPLNA